MSTLRLVGDSSGYVQLVANVAAANNTLTLPNVNDTLANITSPTFLSNIALAGTGTAPAIGMFTPSANTLAFASNSAQVVTINSSGNLGIGTATPLQILHVQGSSYFSSNVGIGSTTPQQTLDVQGNVNVQNTVIMGSSFLRNRIINGAMQIWQRGTSFTTVGSGTWTYTADRMATYCQNSSTTISQSTSVPSNLFQYSLRLQRTAGNAGTNPLVVTQVIESTNCYDLSGQTVTLSFWAKTGSNYSGGNLTVVVYTGTAADQGVNSIGSWTGTATPIVTTTQAISTNWTRYSFTGTFGAGVLEAAPYFLWTPTGTAGADDSLYITGIQLEPGPVATPFERRLYGQEFTLCQRYYQSYGPFGRGLANDYWPIASTQNTPQATTTLWYFPFRFGTPFRAAPVLGSSAASTLTLDNGSPNAVIALATQRSGPDYTTIYASTGSITGNIYGTMLSANNNNTAYVSFSAEL